jgi:alkylated DNA repair protein (DNA oxidative demethylase)
VLQEAGPNRPSGLVYVAEFLSEPEERSLLTFLQNLSFREVSFRGQIARRSVRLFGFDYDLDGRRLQPAPRIPAELDDVRRRCAALGDLDPAVLEQLLVSRYPPSAGIGWHRDAPAYGSKVIGVSLLSTCVMRFRRSASDRWERYRLSLEPRSAYVLSGSARWSWQHSIPPGESLRYSLTFRTVRGASRP